MQRVRGSEGRETPLPASKRWDERAKMPGTGRRRTSRMRAFAEQATRRWDGVAPRSGQGGIRSPEGRPLDSSPTKRRPCGDSLCQGCQQRLKPDAGSLGGKQGIRDVDAGRRPRRPAARGNNSPTPDRRENRGGLAGELGRWAARGDRQTFALRLLGRAVLAWDSEARRRLAGGSSKPRGPMPRRASSTRRPKQMTQKVVSWKGSRR
jgi:hypothetical protein